MIEHVLIPSLHDYLFNFSPQFELSLLKWFQPMASRALPAKAEQLLARG